MGRRSRKRVSAPAAVRAQRRAPAAGREQPPGGPVAGPAASAPLPESSTAHTRRRRDEAPAPPWGSFPLVELAALAAIVVGVVGIVSGGRTGAVLLTVAAMLGSLAGLEVALREHLGGYRSHTLVLSGVAAIATLAVLFFAGVDRATLLPVAVVVFAGAFVVWRAVFKRRSGGYGFRAR
jgi:hypothetical protein